VAQSRQLVEDAFAASLQTDDLTDKQRAVLTACLTLFSQKGFDATSTKDIAQLAHVSEGTVYKKYRSKQGLLDALLAPLATVVVPRLAKEFMGEVVRNDSADFRAFLDFIVRDRMAFAISNRQLIRIMIGRVLNDSQTLTVVLGQFSDAITETIEPILKRYQQAGQLVDWPATTIMRTIASTVIGTTMPYILLGTADLDIDSATVKVVDFLAKGLSPEEERRRR
jgi:AcrR family transcriptional regulator